MMNIDINDKNYVFKNPRKEKIYKRLQLVSEGAADYYLDACKLIDKPYFLSSTSHLVGHLFREIESSIRQILEPDLNREKNEPFVKKILEDIHISEESENYKSILDIAQRLDKYEGKRTLQESINEIAKFMGIKKDDPLYINWKKISRKLHKMTHRDYMEKPRSVDETIIEEWENFEGFLYVILERLENSYFKIIDNTDNILKANNPTKANAKKLKRACPNNFTARKYLFDKLNDPNWITPLFKEKFFHYPPTQFKREDITYAPLWPASQFLSRMSEKAPNEVLDVILSIPKTDNFLIHSDFCKALQNIEPKIGIKALNNVIQWFQSAENYIYPQEYFKLLLHWIEGGFARESLDLCKVLIEVFPEKRNEKSDKAVMELFDSNGENTSDKGETLSDNLPTYDIRARFDSWFYKNIVDSIKEPLAKKAGIDSLILFSDLLEKAIQITKVNITILYQYIDKFYSGPPAIETHEQKVYSNSIMDLLVFAVRDISEVTIQKEGFRTLEIIDSRKYTVFKRISLYLRYKYPEIDPKGTVKILNVYDYDKERRSVFHELYHVLENCFGTLPENVQNVYFQWIMNYSKELEDSDKEDVIPRRKLTKEEKIKDARGWVFDQLWPIRDYLKDAWKNKFDELKTEFKPREHPDFLYYFGGAEWKSQKPDKVYPDLSTKSVDEVIQYLKEQNPDYSIQSLIEDDPMKYSSEVNKLIGLNPTIIHSVFDGYVNAIREKKTFEMGTDS